MTKLLTIKEMQDLAKYNGGNCLSKQYVNARSKLKWKCKKGHTWEASPSNIKAGKWCPKCAHNVKLTINEMQKLAELKGGKCLSDKYKNSQSKLKWQCKEGHIWEGEPSRIKANHWCPYCAHTAKLTIEEMQKLAESRGGKCLSNLYGNANTKLKWQCKEGHVWEARPENIKLGSWCPVCSRKRKSKKRIQTHEEIINLPF